ncbi:hypothetical protein [Curtobacterium sp. SL109]|uniref:hypothetical protein n=1 Tax=Curtobacterium sp. SL109 TaxID=2994662 RepID=UPI002275FC9C|nr:hypothetical protein [Curtobacterium sp. SL109]MCY1696125.1 hypothetical protein [Curtobacterium sp. SL109]
MRWTTGARASTRRRRAGARWRAATPAIGVPALVLVLALSGCGVVSSGASGSCAVKEIELGESALHPGGAVELSVDWMTATCEDTGGVNRTAEDVAVSVTPASTGHEYVLATVDRAVGERYTVRGRFTLPADLPLGDATLAVTSQMGDGAEASRTVTITAP